MAKTNDSMNPGSISLAKNTSVLTSLTVKSLAGPARLGLMGGFIWFVIMLFYFVNDLLAEPIISYPIFAILDILNIVGAFLLFMFIRFLSNQGIDFGLKKLVLMIVAGFALRLLGKVLDAGNYFLINFGVGGDALITGLFLFSDLFHLLGALAIALLMFILFKKEHKKSYKIICFFSAIFALFHAGGYISLFLLDTGIIQGAYIQLLRLISSFTSITLILYFSLLLKDSKKLINLK